MTEVHTLYRTLFRVAAADTNTISLFIPAASFDEPIKFSRDDVQIPRWLLDKEIGYRFFAKTTILAERPEQISLWDCENDPRTVAEQEAAIDAVELALKSARTSGGDQ